MSILLSYDSYASILIFIIVAILLSCVMVGASYFLSNKNPDAEKVSVYECGFDPFGDSRQKFEVRFFLVGILFIIFDLEISFLFPWSIVIGTSTLSTLGSEHQLLAYWSMMFFLGLLALGLVYEWMKGGLEWE